MPLFSSSPSSSSSPSPTSPLPSADGAFQAPNRTARSACWTARDAFFACLDAHGIVDSIGHQEDAARSCGAEEQGLRRDCASSWVTYFKQRRVMEFKRKQTLEKLAAEGARPMPEGMGPPRLDSGR
ncbi:hypothetical protein MMC34_000744 [Xylographa carneopallida]|nr:hypothetical protein [Xylographa carneopallida]